jgi:hypothetical protein
VELVGEKTPINVVGKDYQTKKEHCLGSRKVGESNESRLW